MALFRKKAARVVRRGAVEEPQKETSEQKSSKSKNRNGQRSAQQRARTGKRNNNRSSATQSRDGAQTAEKRRTRPHLEVVPPPNTARKQMLVRSSPHQTQIVVLEGPILVEHYVARSDQKSLVGNVYLGKVRNVLPGMEAAFVVDAVVASGSAGRIHRFRPLTARLPVSIFTALSTHGLNLAKAIELGKELGRVSRSMVVYGIEGADFSAGIGLTREVARAAEEVVDSIGHDLARVSEGVRAERGAMTGRD